MPSLVPYHGIYAKPRGRKYVNFLIPNSDNPCRLTAVLQAVTNKRTEGHYSTMVAQSPDFQIQLIYEIPTLFYSGKHARKRPAGGIQ